MKIAREGMIFIVPSLVLTLLFLVLHSIIPALLFVVLFLFFLYFFRNPRRSSAEDGDTLLSPADGRVVQISTVEEKEFLHRRAKKIGIFMSPFDVHVNRVPCDGDIISVQHRKGKFVPAYREGADSENERNYVLLNAGTDKVLLVQIAGVLARRIVCHKKPGDRVARGEPFGLIMFGSRVDIYLPPHFDTVVQLQQKVKAGVTPLARIKGES